jgi:hypothetical protein
MQRFILGFRHKQGLNAGLVHHEVQHEFTLGLTTCRFAKANVLLSPAVHGSAERCGWKMQSPIAPVIQNIRKRPAHKPRSMMKKMNKTTTEIVMISL